MAYSLGIREKRRLTRVEYGAHAIIRSDKKEKTVEAIVRDISIESIYLYCRLEFRIGERVSVRITLPGQESELVIKVPGKVNRIDPHGIAVAFHRPLDWWPVFTYFPLHKLEDDAIESPSVGQGPLIS
ncbi:PilZ domain-containing protein [Desulfofustis glycolicus]|uniref:PilZ domain-containing protein n=1 Tax=Desulfofustis glycolicus DSM 9705 TaxID=1121409 RepID=A0A1M5S241_9BACT|nr:PilZ domain-containing protein [Desulfofustis glycolicus]MCB2216263.1 PilZ domain-containing protein [Desulfobulbaceae bacterium]SHH32529.1 PilZ domain-containing protein [Desulfofustis glycolicus DSM 9705]